MRLGKYELLVDIAAGGMATLYVARQAGAAGFERLVAIKRVHPHLLRDEAFVEMLRDEARLSSLVRHANVVSASDVVESEGELFLVLDYVESVSLDALIRAAKKRGERIPPPVVSRICCDALAGLHAAHEAVDAQGKPLAIVHRDVSPHNVIVGVDGVSRLIDFGVAKAAARLASTKSGGVKGKLAYMAPEQVQQKSLDRRADVFAAAVTWFEALTGLRLFTGQDEADIALNVLIGEIPKLSEKGLALGDAAEAALEKGLERDPELRFQSAFELAAAIEEAVPPTPHHRVAAYVGDIAGEALAARREQIRERARRPDPEASPVTVAGPIRRRSAWVLAAALGTLAPLGILAFALARSPSSSRPIAAASEVRAAAAAPVDSVPPPPLPVTPPSAAASEEPAIRLPKPGLRPRLRSTKPPEIRDNPY